MRSEEIHQVVEEDHQIAPNMIQIIDLSRSAISRVNGVYYKSNMNESFNGRIYYFKQDNSKYIYWNQAENEWQITNILGSNVVYAYLPDNFSFYNLPTFNSKSTNLHDVDGKSMNMAKVNRGDEVETPIDISMLQGCWQNSCDEEFYVEGHELITQFTSIEIEENDEGIEGFFMHGWLLEKNSKRLEWKKKDQIITWNHLHNISPDDVKEMKCQKWKNSVIASKGSLVCTNPSSKVKGSIFCGLCSKTKRVKCIRKKNEKVPDEEYDELDEIFEEKNETKRHSATLTPEYNLKYDCFVKAYWRMIFMRYN